jgi:hypothetical protein
MKKQILSTASFALLTVSLIFTGCKKDDTTAPVVTIVGSDQTISLQGTYTELGATANDDEDGALTPSSSGTVDVNHTGTYTITYSATDKAGNTGTATRTVTVKNDVESMTGTYTCTISGSPNYVYTQTITASPTTNRRILFGKFGDYAGNTGIYADVTGSTITLPSQTAVAVGNPATNRTFAGTGTIATGTSFGLQYTETTTAGTINTIEGFVKQ